MNIDTAQEIENPSGFVYNLVLDSNHILVVDGVECITWGHDYQEDVVRHAYYGSQAIINDLKNTAGWSRGRINIIACKKDSNMTVTGIVASDEIII